MFFDKCISCSIKFTEIVANPIVVFLANFKILKNESK